MSLVPSTSSTSSTHTSTVYQVPEAKELILSVTNCTSKHSAPMPGEKKKSSNGHTSPHRESSSNNGEWVEMNGFRDQEVTTKGKGKYRNIDDSPDSPIINDFLTNGSANMSNKNDFDSHLGRYSNGGHTQLSYDSRDSSFDQDLDDPGPHREMAIDVPENFVASVKSPPRYPPPMPRSHPVTSPTKAKVDNSQTNSKNINSKAKSSNQPAIQPTPQELERLHRHQEDLKKRREEEQRQQAEQEFLRASLRGSKKLQALENKRPLGPAPSGFVNTAFDDEDDDEDEEGLDDTVDKSHLTQSSDGMVEERYLKKNICVEDLFSSLHHIRNSLSSHEDQKYISLVRMLFQKDQFQRAVNIHNQMVEITSRSPPIKPVTDDTRKLVDDLRRLTDHTAKNSYAQELNALMNKTHLRSLLEAHDIVAHQTLQAIENIDLSGEPLDYPLVQYGEDSVKIIHLEKTNEHLGATVKNEGESVIIARIVKGGAAEKSGLLHEGDEILEVNGIDMRGKNINDVSEMLANMSGTITFMIIPGHHPITENVQRLNSVMHLRALFSYDPEDDPYIPCRELGISFLRGDILHAIALDDPNWWQAFREGEEEDQSLAGLIPSKSFTEQREAMKNSLENKENKRKGRVCACGRKERKKRKKKKLLYNGSSEDSEEILTYEEIAKYYPQPNRKRPIVLIGPSNVGRNELQHRLLDTDPDRFGTPVPHTTRPPRANEAVLTYHHITKEEFNLMVQQNHFVEYGEHQKCQYGTSFDAIRDVISLGKVCLLKQQPETLKVMRSSDLKPYIIFVRPPNLDKLRQLQEQLDKVRPLEDMDTRRTVFSDEQLKEIIDKAREMEDLYGHLFDFVLVNVDLDRAYAELLEEINRIEIEPQWVPASWIEHL
ncbi:protein PALS1-like isoform X2 [Physella acuta]|nr:protein PALS1-like isoform X2 [Physella acuta]